MNAKTMVVLFTLLALLTGACSFNMNLGVERGSGNVIMETRDVSGFSRLSLSGIGDVILTQGETESLEIEAEDNLIPYIKTEVRGNTLFISYERKSVVPTESITFHLSMEEIDGLETLGISNIRSDEVVTDRLDIGIRGTGNVSINQLEADTLTVNVSGAGNFDAEGEVDEQKIVLSGAGNYDGEDLQSSTTVVTISGIGRVNVWVTDKLDVTISGTGGVDYFGEPDITRNISGIGNLNHQGNK
jgi:hypothetical protein